MGIPVRKTNLKHAIKSFEKSRTSQADIHSGDVQKMVDNLGLSSTIERAQIANQAAVYADVSDLPESLSEAINFVADIQHGFENLPAEIKQSIGNDWQRYPELFLDSHAQQHKHLYEKHGFMQKQESKSAEPPPKAPPVEQNGNEPSTNQAPSAS